MPDHMHSPWWLPGGHAQTLYPPLLRKGPCPAYRRATLETPDGDFIDCDWLAPERRQRALLVLFHGLEGSSRSHYARGLMRAAQHQGWQAVVPHFRGCSGRPNRLARAYHSGDSAEIDWLLRHFSQLCPDDVPMFAVGVSLGGNALLKWLGEQGQRASHLLAAAAAVCPPLDLNVSGRALDKGFNRLYVQHFLRTLKPKVLGKLATHPGLLDAERLRAARSLFEFDDLFTGPIHGFRGAEDYWTQASSKPWLRHIAVPTLLLTADNDPFVPAAALPSPQECSAELIHCHTRSGGHVGFISPPWPGSRHWLAEKLIHFLARSHHFAP